MNDFFGFLEKLSLVVNSKNGQMFFCNFKLPSGRDISIVRESYDFFIPFLIESASGQHDIYCYDFEQQRYPTIAVVSDHAVVNRWNSVPDFLAWLECMTNQG